MLSFWRDQGPQDILGQNVPDTAQGQNQASGQAQDEQFMTVATRGKNVRKTTMLLAVFFVLGLVCLWLMIKKSAPPPAAAASTATEESRIEMAMKRLFGARSEMFSRMDEIINKFYEFSDVQQVLTNELVKNPFELRILLARIKKGLEQAPPQYDPELMRRLELIQQAEAMRLLSIIKSDRGNGCMIDVAGKILREGDTIKDFEIRQIGDDSVKLMSGDVEVVLKLLE
jgi:preprotein translocase subunit SecG